MKAKSPNRLSIGMLMVGVLITASAGCERPTRHKVLNFFFTGVPPLEEEKKVEAPGVPAPEDKVVVIPKRYSHPLWTAGQCEQCHRTTASFSVPGVKKRTPAVFKKGMESPGQLVMPREELCIRCHIDKSAAKAQEQGLWLHTTAAKRECHKCHDPHQSDHQYLLLEDSRQICIPCHTDPKIMESAAHQEPGECLSCHNPHLGKNKKMVKKEYEEVKPRVSLSPDLPGPTAPPGDLPKRGSTAQE